MNIDKAEKIRKAMEQIRTLERHLDRGKFAEIMGDGDNRAIGLRFNTFIGSKDLEHYNYKIHKDFETALFVFNEIMKRSINKRIADLKLFIEEN